MADEEDKRNTKDHFYRLLRVDRSATAAEIKKAYHSLALRLHPDKNPDANSEEWVEIQTAYEVLSDPAKRKIYDKFGIQGLQAQEMYGNVLPPGMLAHGLAVIGAMVCMASMLVLLFVIFVALKAGGTVTWKWPVVFIPLWILDSAVISFLLKDWVVYCRRHRNQSESEEEGGQPGVGAFVFLTLFALQILVDLKLEGYAIAPMVVVIPLLVLFGCLCLCCCVLACVGFVLGRSSDGPEPFEESGQSAPFNFNGTDERDEPPQQPKEEPVNIHQSEIVVNVDADAMD